MKRIGKVSLILLAGLALAGCNRKKDNTKSKHNSRIKVTYAKKTNKKGHLSANDLSPQKTVAVITAYAGNRYSGGWNKALSKGQANSLQVNLRNQDDYSYMKDGSGVAYMVTANAGYTLKQDGKSNIYYLFSNGKELESVSMQQMIDYLNKRDSDALVNDLAKNAKVNDERSSFDGDDADDSNKKSNDNQTVSPKVLGTMVGLLKSPKWFKYNLKGGTMYFMSNTSKYTKDGFYCVTANGDPTSFFYYKQNGDQVIIKYVDASHSETVAGAPTKIEKVSLNRLIKDYYVTNAQKEEVNGYANKLKPYSSTETKVN